MLLKFTLYISIIQSAKFVNRLYQKIKHFAVFMSFSCNRKSNDYKKFSPLTFYYYLIIQPQPFNVKKIMPHQ